MRAPQAHFFVFDFFFKLKTSTCLRSNTSKNYPKSKSIDSNQSRSGSQKKLLADGFSSFSSGWRVFAPHLVRVNVLWWPTVVFIGHIRTGQTWRESHFLVYNLNGPYLLIRAVGFPNFHLECLCSLNFVWFTVDNLLVLFKWKKRVLIFFFKIQFYLSKSLPQFSFRIWKNYFKQ